MTSFSAFLAGEPIPAVDPQDLRAVSQLSHKLRAQFLQNSETDIATPPPSIDVTLMAGACAPGANVIAVSLRSAFLDAMLGQGPLAPWRCSAGLDQAVFNATATFPIPALDRFDANDFVRSLAERRD